MRKEDNKLLKLIQNILFAVFMIVIVFLIIITAQSKFTGMEPSLFGNRMYIVDSGSMEPTLPLNSLIVVKEKTADEIEVGDILTYDVAEGTRVTHRVIELGENKEYFITQGDANNVADSMPVERENVIGAVTLIIPYIGYGLRFLSSTPGIILLLGIAILTMVVPMLLKRNPKEA